MGGLWIQVILYLVLTTRKKVAFESIVCVCGGGGGKWNSSNWHFSLSHNVYYPSLGNLHLKSHIEMSRALWKGGLIAFAKSFGSDQPAQSVQADLSRNFSIWGNFLNVKGPFYLIIKVRLLSWRTAISTIIFSCKFSIIKNAKYCTTFIDLFLPFFPSLSYLI